MNIQNWVMIEKSINESGLECIKCSRFKEKARAIFKIELELSSFFWIKFLKELEWARNKSYLRVSKKYAMFIELPR